MANMSYCRFENTASALADCVGALEDALEAPMHITDFEASLGSDNERRGLKNLIEHAERLLEIVEDLRHTYKDDE